MKIEIRNRFRTVIVIANLFRHRVQLLLIMKLFRIKLYSGVGVFCISHS